jgi:ATP synthase protein I
VSLSADSSVESSPEVEEGPPDSSLGENSMQEYFALQRELLLTTLVFGAVICLTVLGFYGFKTAASFLLGVSTSLLYLRLLGRAVERIGKQGGQLGKSRLALFVLIIFIASIWNQLEVIPVFLGFLTYKVALIYYTLRLTLLPQRQA